MEQMVETLHRYGGCEPPVLFAEDETGNTDAPGASEQIAVMCVDRVGKLLFATTRALALSQRWNAALDASDAASRLLSLPGDIDTLYAAGLGQSRPQSEPAQAMPSRWSLCHPVVPELMLTVDTDGRQLPDAAQCCLLWLEEKPVTACLQALSPSERRVALLVARGLRNHEIAQMLCRSRRTVEFQLNSIYRKLQISCRTQLVRVLL